MSALFDYKHTFTHHHYNLATGDQVSEMVPIIPATNWGKKFSSPKMKTILSCFAYFERSMEWELRICALPKTQAPFRDKSSQMIKSQFECILQNHFFFKTLRFEEVWGKQWASSLTGFLLFRALSNVIVRMWSYIIGDCYSPVSCNLSKSVE